MDVKAGRDESDGLVHAGIIPYAYKDGKYLMVQII